MSSNPIPGPEASELEKLQYEHAVLWAAYQQRGKELKDLEVLLGRYQSAFGIVQSAIQGALV